MGPAGRRRSERHPKSAATPIAERHVLADVAALELHSLSWRRVRKAVAAIADVFAKHDLLTYSSAMAFQILIAVVPLAMLTLAGLSVVGAGSVYHDHIAPALHRDLSPDAYRIADRTVTKVIGPERYYWCTGGVLITLWGVAAAMRSTMTPLNGVYATRETRSWLRRFVISLVAAALFLACIFGAFAAVIGGAAIDAPGVLGVVVSIGRWIIALALLLLAIVAVLRFVPARRRPVEWATLGSTLSVVCWIVATIGFGAYIQTVSYSSIYGSLAAVILLLAYLHVSAIAFLLGVVVDSLVRDLVSRDRGRRGRGRRRAGT